LNSLRLLLVWLLLPLMLVRLHLLLAELVFSTGVESKLYIMKAVPNKPPGSLP